MELTQRPNLLKSGFLIMLKSFLIWSFTLTVCFLVIGFPLGVVIVSVGAILSIAAQSVLPVSGILLVTGSLIAIQVLGVMVSATILTSKGIHPEDVSWLHWLHGNPNPLKTPIFASCPLTRDIAGLN